MLDDPLAALDAHVGQKVFQKIIGNEGMLNGTTRIMVTHNVSLSLISVEPRNLLYHHRLITSVAHLN